MEESRAPEWTCSDVLQLIREYGNRPALWDPDCEDYKNRCRKHQKWQELADIFKCSKLEVERKMKILMSQYRRERLKAERMRRMGMTHRVTWYGYKAFAFMNKQWVRYKNRSSLMRTHLIKQENAEDGEEFTASGTELIPFLDEDEGHHEENMLDSTLLSDTHSYGHENVSETSLGDNKEFENTQSHHKDVGHTKDGVVKVLYDSKDEWALFGELVAHAFRKLPDDKTRCIVKHKINTVLYEAELASYSDKLG